MRRSAKIFVGSALGLIVLFGGSGLSSAKPKGPKTIMGCTEEQLNEPGARQCIDQSVLRGDANNSYVVCGADGSMKCCWKEGDGEACTAIRRQPAGAGEVTAPVAPRRPPAEE